MLTQLSVRHAPGVLGTRPAGIGDVSTAESNYSAGGKAESISPAYRLRPLYGGKAELKP